MKLLVITFSTDNTNPGLVHLRKSLTKYGYDYVVLNMPEFSWGGDNYTIIANWLKENRRDYTHILYTDAWDTLAFNRLSEKDVFAFKEGTTETTWIFSGEKNPCFASNLSKYDSPNRWKYICAGNYIVPIDLFINIVQEVPRVAGENDQQWASRVYELGTYPIGIDTHCELFQTLYNMNGLHQTPNWGEFAINDQYEFVNLITLTKPVFVHGNGKVDMRSIYHHQYKK